MAGLVDEITDDKTIDKQERKRLQVEHAPKKSQEQRFSSLQTRRAT